jgi:hypothetical protein
MLCLANVYFLIRLISYDDKRKLALPVWAGALVSILLVSYNMKTTQTMYPTFMKYSYVALVTVLIVSVGVVLLCRVKSSIRNSVISVFTLAIVICGISVLPIVRGYDGLYRKPASEAVQNIVEADPDAKWIGYGNIITPQFLIANGAPTINSVNYIPNMELWGKLDPEGKYNEVYNRYSHIILGFTDDETTFSLVQPDLMNLDINYSDLEKTGAKYVFVLGELIDNSDAVDLKLLYHEGNVLIYEIVYN